MNGRIVVGLAVVALGVVAWLLLREAPQSPVYTEQAKQDAPAPITRPEPTEGQAPQPDRAPPEDPPVPARVPEEVPDAPETVFGPEPLPQEKLAPVEPRRGATTFWIPRGEHESWAWEAPLPVERAVRKAVTWLKKKQQRNGSWGEIRSNPDTVYGRRGHLGNVDRSGGVTALVLYTLLSARELEKDPVIRKGFDYVKKVAKRPANPQVTSTLLLALTATARPYKRTGTKPPRIKLKGKYRSWATRLVDDLVDRRTEGGWRYAPRSEPYPDGAADLFNTHLAAWALFTAHRAGIRVKKRVWEDVLAFTLRQQQRTGDAVTYVDRVGRDTQVSAQARGFAYVWSERATEESRATGALTACGLTNLALAQWILTDGQDPKRMDRWRRREDAPLVDAALTDGLGWLVKSRWTRNFENPDHSDQRIQHGIALWNLQCAMDALRRDELGVEPWYEELGRKLLLCQRGDGSFRLPGAYTWEPADVLDTCFAILYLTRASRRWMQ